MSSDAAVEELEPEENETSVRSQLQMLLGFVAALLTAILFDFGIYHGFGFSGWAFFFVGALAAYFAGTLPGRSHLSSWLIAVLILLLGVRLVWLGTGFQCFVGVLLLAAYGMSRNGSVPYLIEFWVYLMQSLIAGFPALRELYGITPKLNRNFNQSTLMNYGLPSLAVLVFGGIFVVANPDLAQWTGQFFSSVNDWIERLNPDEILLFCFIFWLAVGQLVPWMKAFSKSRRLQMTDEVEGDPVESESELYFPYRNTLLAVIGLFAIYLVFEFQTLWFREFPEGFYYAGYAHKGAAWLTFALALATASLSVIFKDSILHDPRLQQLKKLAWIWSAANLILALAVYNRMWLYIDFNGMTRMRVVGLFGITTVIAGFLLVIWKIYFQRSFPWLIQRQLWALALAIYLLTLTPVDFLIHSYNANQILSGNLAPAVQITEHPVNLGGWLALVPLLECEDEIIRDGIREQLRFIARNDGLDTASKRNAQQNPDHWTAYQLASVQIMIALTEPDAMARLEASRQDDSAWVRFRKYAYQWY